jgi:hypothetical protein
VFEDNMRSLFGGFLIVAGAAVAAIGLGRTQIAEPGHAAGPLVARVQQHPAPISAVVTLPAKVPSTDEPARLMTAVEPAAGPALVHELQHELARVGCYDGAINGFWTLQTRKSMAAFVERANAKLPTDKPDAILLALIRHHTGPACGSCPSGREASSEGQCVPKVIAARATILKPDKPLPVVNEKPRTAEANLPKPSRRSHRRALIEGRMGVGAPIVALKPVEREPKVATAQPPPSDLPTVVEPRQNKRAARHSKRHITAHSRSYRSMRGSRFAYRPFGRPQGLAALLFGWF